MVTQRIEATFVQPAAEQEQMGQRRAAAALVRGLR
jgi:hypothetical protein